METNIKGEREREERDAEEKAEQNRSQSGRQRRTRRSPQTLRRRRDHLLCHNRRRLSPPTLRSLLQRALLQIPSHRPILLNDAVSPLLSSHRNPRSRTPMEIEVKLRLPDAAAHQTLLSLLSPFHRHTHRQHNTFFDGAAAELSSRRAVLRLRFYDDDAKCVVCLKAKAVLTNGVSRVEEDEEELDPLLGRECVADPPRLGGVHSRIMTRVRDEFGVSGGGFVCLGGFRNLRGVYDWNGLVLEVDETLFDFGTLYEIECESEEPEKAKKLIEEFLKENGIGYSYSEASKFAIFRSGKLPL